MEGSLGGGNGTCTRRDSLGTAALRLLPPILRARRRKRRARFHSGTRGVHENPSFSVFPDAASVSGHLVKRAADCLSLNERMPCPVKSAEYLRRGHWASRGPQRINDRGADRPLGRPGTMLDLWRFGPRRRFHWEVRNKVQYERQSVFDFLCRLRAPVLPAELIGTRNSRRDAFSAFSDNGFQFGRELVHKNFNKAPIPFLSRERSVPFC